MDINIDELQLHLEHESKTREILREETGELEKRTRGLIGALNKIHSTLPADVPSLLVTLKPLLASCRESVIRITNAVPENQFWRWKESWTAHLRNTVFAAAFIRFLENGTLLSFPEASQILGVDPDHKDRLYLQTEDYLIGLITLVNELSRLVVNQVTLGDFQGPFRISAFVRDIFAGFSVLNLKNDQLRRRFDSLKYDIKQIEEVVYDISVRRLRPLYGENNRSAEWVRD